MSILDHGLRASAATISGALAGSDSDEHGLLDSVVRAGRAVMNAAACSVFLHDPERDELVFEAVCGEGEDHLIGTRFPADRGIAGWVLATGEATAVSDLENSRHFARDLAARTGYIPDTILAAPVAFDGHVLGVLQVLDPDPSGVLGLADLEALTRIADLAGHGLDGLVRIRAARRAMSDSLGDLTSVAELGGLVMTLSPERRPAALQMIASLQQVIGAMSGE